MINASTIFYAGAGGILPALAWLAFWLREDKLHPEPRRLLLRTFGLGMLAVILVLPFQALFASFLYWAALEEIFKLAAAWWGGLRTRDDDEPLDPLIYMITAALGFAAFENALYIFSPLLDANIGAALVTLNVRFVGASVLHIITSGIVGTGLALAFYRKKGAKIIFITVALALAILYHAAFNLILINLKLGGVASLALVWVSIAVLLLVFERVKKL